MDNDASIKSGASDVNSWFRSPESLKETITKSFCLNLDGNEISDYIYTIGTMYGNPDMGNMRTPLQKPNAPYVLALDIVSMWLSNRLMQEYLLRQNGKGGREICNNPKDDEGNLYLFNGTKYTRHTIRDDDACKACFASKSQEHAWCDCKDNVRLGKYSSSDKPLTKEQRKRIMHNIQDIGDFLGVPIDNTTIMEDGRHVPRMLLEDVFIPALKAEQDCRSYLQSNEYGGDGKDAYNPKPGADASASDRCTDYEAWQQVVHAVLMSGPFYMKLETVER